ncbi:MAG: hypothetical protein ACRCZF_15105, partial [Gemmataceae bacterium]
MNTTEYVWTGDTTPVVPTVVQMWRHGTRDLSSYLPPTGRARWDVCAPRPYYVREVPGAAGFYSTYPAGMELFATPVILTADLAGVNVENGVAQEWLEKLTASLVGAASLALLFLVLVRLSNVAAAAVLTAMLATGSVYFTTIGMLLWQQGGILFFMLVALAVELHTHGRPGWRGLLIQGFACGTMLACRPSAVTFLVPFGIWVLARDWHRGVVLPILAGLAFLPWMFLYQSLYQQPFGPSLGFLKEPWFFAENMLAVLCSPGRGLLVYQPFLGLLPLLMLPAVQRTRSLAEPRGFLIFACSSIALHWLLVGSWPMWWGGFCYGSRLAAEIVLLGALLAIRPVAWILQRPGGWTVLASLGILGFAIHAPCAFYDAWNWNALPISADAHPERLADWSAPPFLFNMGLSGN